jgi:hypothetical protein
MVLDIWAEQMTDRFDLMHKGYDVAEATLEAKKARPQ